MKYADAAEELFKKFALRHSLRTEKMEHEYTDLMIEVAIQPGLTTVMTLSLSDDELQVGFGEHWGCWYLQDDMVAQTMKDFIETCDGLIEGYCRVVEYWQFGKPVKTAIERNIYGKWDSISVRYSPFVLPFFKVHLVVIQNRTRN
jgi:hypothetical protein